MFRKLSFAAFAALITIQSAHADVTGPGGKVIDCYCTDTGGSRVELGETICMFVDGRAFMAQCQMSLNVPMWREVQSGCLSSYNQSRPDGAQPPLDPGAVHAKI